MSTPSGSKNNPSNANNEDPRIVRIVYNKWAKKDEKRTVKIEIQPTFDDDFEVSEPVTVNNRPLPAPVPTPVITRQPTVTPGGSRDAERDDDLTVLRTVKANANKQNQLKKTIKVEFQPEPEEEPQPPVQPTIKVKQEPVTSHERAHMFSTTGLYHASGSSVLPGPSKKARVETSEPPVPCLRTVKVEPPSTPCLSRVKQEPIEQTTAVPSTSSSTTSQPSSSIRPNAPAPAAAPSTFTAIPLPSSSTPQQNNPPAAPPTARIPLSEVRQERVVASTMTPSALLKPRPRVMPSTTATTQKPAASCETPRPVAPVPSAPHPVKEQQVQQPSTMTSSAPLKPRPRMLPSTTPSSNSQTPTASCQKPSAVVPTPSVSAAPLPAKEQRAQPSTMTSSTSQKPQLVVPTLPISTKVRVEPSTMTSSSSQKPAASTPKEQDKIQMRPVTLARSPTNQSFTATRREADPAVNKTPSNRMTATSREADLVAARNAAPLTLSKIVEAVSSAAPPSKLFPLFRPSRPSSTQSSASNVADDDEIQILDDDVEIIDFTPAKKTMHPKQEPIDQGQDRQEKTRKRSREEDTVAAPCKRPAVVTVVQQKTADVADIKPTLPICLPSTSHQVTPMSDVKPSIVLPSNPQHFIPTPPASEVHSTVSSPSPPSSGIYPAQPVHPAQPIIAAATPALLAAFDIWLANKNIMLAPADELPQPTVPVAAAAVDEPQAALAGAVEQHQAVHAVVHTPTPPSSVVHSVLLPNIKHEAIADEDDDVIVIDDDEEIEQHNPVEVPTVPKPVDEVIQTESTVLPQTISSDPIDSEIQACLAKLEATKKKEFLESLRKLEKENSAIVENVNENREAKKVEKEKEEKNEESEEEEESDLSDDEDDDDDEIKNDDVIDDIIGAISDTDDDELSDSDTDSEEQYMVEEILDKRRNTDGEVEYLVKWKDYSVKESTWEPESNLDDCQDIVDKFERARKKANQTLQGISSVAKRAESVEKSTRKADHKIPDKTDQLGLKACKRCDNKLKVPNNEKAKKVHYRQYHYDVHFADAKKSSFPTDRWVERKLGGGDEYVLEARICLRCPQERMFEGRAELLKHTRKRHPDDFERLKRKYVKKMKEGFSNDAIVHKALTRS